MLPLQGETTLPPKTAQRWAVGAPLLSVRLHAFLGVHCGLPTGFKQPRAAGMLRRPAGAGLCGRLELFRRGRASTCVFHRFLSGQCSSVDQRGQQCTAGVVHGHFDLYFTHVHIF